MPVSFRALRWARARASGSGSEPVRLIPGWARFARRHRLPVPQPISRTCWPGASPAWATGHRHIHDFPVLVYFERAGDGSACLVAPGTVIEPELVDELTTGCCVFFDPTAIGGDGWSSWQAHPLLLPFLHGTPSGLLRLT